MTATCNRLFVYGSLLEPALRAQLLGRPVEVVSAVLRDFARCRGRYWYVSPAPGDQAGGLILEGLGERDFAILDDYEECPALYVRELRTVTRGDGAGVDCWIYLPTDAAHFVLTID